MRLRRIRQQMPDATLLNCTPNVGHNLTSEGAVYETFI